MKQLINISVMLILISSGCTNVPKTLQENGPTTTALTENLQDSTPTASNIGEDTPAHSIEVVGGDEQSLREFIQLWLGPVDSNSPSQQMTVSIGSLPEEMPYELPKPDDARIIGGVTGGWTDYRLILDTSLSSKSVHEFYAQSLTGKGWHPLLTNGGQGGFINEADFSSEYCYEHGDAFLTVQTPSVSDGKTTIRLYLDLSPEIYNCGDFYTSSVYPSEKLIPNLDAPAGTIIQNGGGSGSPYDAEVTASLKSSLSAIELAEFYHPQLLVLGWTMRSSGSEEGAAWSHWTFTDEHKNSWLGSLIVLKASPHSDRLFVVCRIEEEK